jgi:hypothetical protein
MPPRSSPVEIQWGEAPAEPNPSVEREKIPDFREDEFRIGLMIQQAASVLSLNCRLFSLSSVLRGEGRSGGLFKPDNPFQKIPSG